MLYVHSFKSVSYEKIILDMLINVYLEIHLVLSLAV